VAKCERLVAALDAGALRQDELFHDLVVVLAHAALRDTRIQ
jgi:hypothetical protein